MEIAIVIGERKIGTIISDEESCFINLVGNLVRYGRMTMKKKSRCIP